MISHYILWSGFLIFVLISFLIDLGVFAKPEKKDHIPTVKESAWWTVIWTLAAILFGFALRYAYGIKESEEFFAGYILERCLSIDNIFVFIIILDYFKIKQELRQRILVTAIIRALFLRAVFIFLGAELIERFHWVLYLFGAFLLFTGIKLLITEENEDMDIEHNPIVRFFKKFFTISENKNTSRTFIRENGKLMLTNAFIVTCVIATSDIVFALDSIPAVFGVTTNFIIVFTANVFSLMGLRSIFFIVTDILKRFYYLKYALSGILVFVGAKMIVEHFLTITSGQSLLIICVILATAIIASLLKKQTK